MTRSSPDIEYASNPLRDALLRGFLSTSTSEGEHHIKISFETLEQMQDARKALYHAIRRRPSSPDAAATRQAGWAIFEQAMVMLEDVPGDTMLERIARLKDWYQQLYNTPAQAVAAGPCKVSLCDDGQWMVHTEGDIIAYPGQGNEEQKARQICAALNGAAQGCAKCGAALHSDDPQSGDWCEDYCGNRGCEIFGCALSSPVGAAQGQQELIAQLQYEAGMYRSLYENAIETCATVAEGFERGNRFCKHDDCPYPDCLVEGGICPSQPPAVSSTGRATPPASFLCSSCGYIGAPESDGKCICPCSALPRPHRETL